MLDFIQHDKEPIFNWAKLNDPELLFASLEAETNNCLNPYENPNIVERYFDYNGRYFNLYKINNFKDLYNREKFYKEIDLYRECYQSEFAFSNNDFISINAVDAGGTELFYSNHITPIRYNMNDYSLFDNFAKLGNNLIECIKKLDAKNFYKLLFDWVKNYGCLNHKLACPLECLLYKAITASTLQKLLETCQSKNNNAIKENLYTSYYPEEKIYSIGIHTHQSNFFYAGEEQSIWFDGVVIKFIKPSIFNDFYFDIEDKTQEDFYLQLALYCLAYTAVKIINDSPLLLSPSLPQNISGSKNIDDDYIYSNLTGYYVNTNIKFSNLEQLIFYQFLQQLYFDPKRRKCTNLDCNEILTGRPQQMFCSDKCRKTYSRKYKLK